MNGYPAAEKFVRQAERIAEELNKIGLKTDVVQNGQFPVSLTEKGEISLPTDGYAFCVFLDKDKYLGNMLAAQGLRLFNPPRAVEICDDKLSTYLALQGADVRLIQSIPAPLCYTQGATPNGKFLRQVADTLSFPLVAKLSYGSFGKGVRLIHGMDELYETERAWLHSPHFYQHFIPTGGQDVRVIVIGGKTVAAMTRTAKEGEFRSNVELGGSCQKTVLTVEEEKTAITAAQTLGLDYCGVDLLRTDGGVAICEVNSNAFFEGIESATGVNVAALYANHIRNSLQNP